MAVAGPQDRRRPCPSAWYVHEVRGLVRLLQQISLIDRVSLVAMPGNTMCEGQVTLDNREGPDCAPKSKYLSCPKYPAFSSFTDSVA